MEGNEGKLSPCNQTVKVPKRTTAV